MPRQPFPHHVYLCRHGETEWSKSGQHTSHTDLPLTEAGVEQAERLAARIAHHKFDRVYVSPLQRARHTCEIAGYGGIVADDLFEWEYGDYEGITTAEIRKKEPKWEVFSCGGPNGESPEDVTARADRMIKTLYDAEGDVALFSSGHFLRALTARWLEQPVTLGRHLELGTGTLSILSYYREFPVLKLWNSPS